MKHARLSLKFAQTTAYALAIAEMLKYPARGPVLASACRLFSFRFAPGHALHGTRFGAPCL